MNRNQELLAKRNEDIFNDFIGMYFKMVPPNEIFVTLEVKYYLTHISLSRIVNKRLKIERAKSKTVP